MKYFIIFIIVAAGVGFSGCDFETDGNFAGLIAGAGGSDGLKAPSNVQVIADPFGGIQISWDGLENADGYTIFRSSAADTARFVRRGSSGTSAFTDSGASVPPDTPFYYQVTAYNSEGTSSPSATAGPVMAQRNDGILAEPEITGAEGILGNITINWTAVNGADGYILYRASEFDSDIFIIRINTDALSYTDAGMPPGLFWYQVRGFNAGGEGYLSLPWGPVSSNAPGGTQPAPAAPQNLRASQDIGSQAAAVNISWNPVSGADRYYVYRSADDELYEEIGQTVSPSYLDTADASNLLRSGGAYFYRVRGYSGSQAGFLSAPAGPVLLLPGKPDVSVSVLDAAVTVSWPAVFGADGYFVYRSSDNAQFSLVGGSLTDNSYIDSGLADGIWYYQVEARNSAGRGPVSDTRQAVVTSELTDAQAPIISVHPAGGSYALNDPAAALTVTASVNDGGTLSYQWYSNNQNSTSGGTVISEATSSSYTPPTNATGTLWYYAVVTNTNDNASGTKTATAVSNTAEITVTAGSHAGIEVPEGGTIITISSQAELAAIRNHIGNPQFNNSRNAYILTQDITLSGTWTPIGHVETVDQYGNPTGGLHPFSGNFYGNGHTIRNLVLQGGSINLIGLFGYIDESLIQDLQIELGETTLSLTGSNARTVGIIAGMLRSSIIRNCSVYASSGITVNGNSYQINVSGISFNDNANNTVENASIIENCYVSMNITVINTGTHISIAGIGNGNVRVKNSYYIGHIAASGTYAYSHGISTRGNSVTEMSYSTGKIVNNATSSGYTSASGINEGGIINNSATLIESIQSSFNFSKIQHSQGATVNNEAILTNNYAYAGMLLNGDPVVSTDANSRQGLDKSAAQFKQQATWEDGLGWDFDDVWEMGPPSYPFPILQWQNSVVKLPQGFAVITDAGTANLSASTPTEFAAALSAVQSGAVDTNYIITVNADLNLGPQNLTLAGYRNKTITLRGNTAARKISLSSQGSLLTVGEDVELVLEDIVLEGRENNNAPLVSVPGGKLVLNDGGKVTGNTFNTSVTDTGGGGIFVDGGTLEIAGGKVEGNTVEGNTIRVHGGGVFVISDSIVLMTSGSIKNNSVSNIGSGTKVAYGGGIAIGIPNDNDNSFGNSSFEMIGGYIEGNTLIAQTTGQSGGIGGGIFISDSSFFLKGGIIRDNNINITGSGYSSAFGGGVYYQNNSRGAIHNNFYNYDYIFEMSGGTINGNSVTSSNANTTYWQNPVFINGSYGGGVHIGPPYYDNYPDAINRAFRKTGGIIFGDEAEGNDPDGIPLKNTAQSNSTGLGGGHAVYFDIGAGNANPRRNSTADENHDLDSSKTGAEGGWD